MSSIPADLFYTRSHEWIRLEGSRAVIGITDHAQHELGDLVYAEPLAIGRVVRAGDPIGSLESVKAASDVYAALPGTVVESNQAIVDDPALLNTDPYGQPLVALTLESTADIAGAGLMDAAAYATFLGVKE